MVNSLLSSSPHLFKWLKTFPHPSPSSAFLLLLLLAVLGVHCCAGFALVAVSGGYTPVALQGFLVAVASLVVEHHSRSWGLSSCGLWALSTGSVVVAHWLSCSMAC